MRTRRSLVPRADDDDDEAACSRVFESSKRGHNTGFLIYPTIYLHINRNGLERVLDTVAHSIAFVRAVVGYKMIEGGGHEGVSPASGCVSVRECVCVRARDSPYHSTESSE